MLYNQRQIKNAVEPFAKKAGVSLIAVLLFMLIATIAATATYKWITSEGRSSASRMLQREAYESSVAGIENAQSWMTYHANEVGALIKQFQDGQGKPILLNNQLTPNLRGNQKYDVWLTGVDATSPSNIKLKIQSLGKTRDNAKHSELAIFRVGGLYRVTIPGAGVVFDFDKAFAGALGNQTNSPSIQSALVNGNFTGNQPSVTESMVVTGDVVLQGPKSGGTGLAGADLYVGGNMTLNGNTVIGSGEDNVVYVGKNITGCEGADLEVNGDMVVEGNYPATCDVDVTGNLTVGGTLSRGDADRQFKVTKNLVFKEEGTFSWTGTVDYSTKPGVGANSYLHAVDGKNESGNRKIKLGSKIYVYKTFAQRPCQNSCKENAYSLTCTGMTQRCPNGYCEGFFESCDKDGTVNVGLKSQRYFSFYSPEDEGRVQSKDADKIEKWASNDKVLKNVDRPCTTMPGPLGGPGVTHCAGTSKYWKNIDKMKAYGQLIKTETNEIPQPIVLNNPEIWLQKVANRHCRVLGYANLDKQQVGEDGAIKSPDMQNADKSQAVFNDINACYQKLSETNDPILYNGFMIVKFMGDAGTNMAQNMSGLATLVGNFVFYFPDQLTTDFFLPATSPTSTVLLYMPNGINSQKFLMGAGDAGSANPRGDYEYNYFVFAEGNIKLKSVKINGSVVMGKNEAGTQSVAQLDDGDVDLQYNGNVLQALGDAGLIKQNEEYTAVVNGAAEVGGGVHGGEDEYYVATAPQLHVSLVSQYENNEPIPSGVDAYDELGASFVILPRLIHLPNDPYGKLEDYFSVVNLNGSDVEKNMANLDNCDGLPTSGLLYPNRDHVPAPKKLKAGIYKCEYTASGKTVPFYVKVSNISIDGKPEVGFSKSYQEMGATDSKPVQLKYTVSDVSQPFSVTVRKPRTSDLPAGWSIAATSTAIKDGTTCEDEDNVCTFSGNFNVSPAPTIFTVTTSNASAGDIMFQMVDCDGCQVDNSANIEQFGISTMAEVHREDLYSYCTLEGVSCSEEYQSMMDKTTWPDCQTSIPWVQAVGNNCVTNKANDSWSCGLARAITLQPLQGNVPDGCEIVIPSDETNNKISNPATDGNYTLYASLKAQPQTFILNFAGDFLAGKTVTVTSDRLGTQTCSYKTTSTDGVNGCTFNLFTGDNITLEVDDDDFAYWECDAGSANCYSSEPQTGEKFTIGAVNGANTVIANFNRKDAHCFFDEFSTSRDCVGSGSSTKYSYCFDKCAVAGTSCAIGGGTFSGLSKWIVLNTANTLLEYSDGHIWLKETHLHGKKQADVEPLKVLSTVEPGHYGTLRAQFVVPRLGRRDDESSVRVRNSGFILRSDAAANSYLILNIYANRDGYLESQVCVGAACVTRQLLGDWGNVNVGITDIVTLSATISSIGDEDWLNLETVLGYHGSYTTATASINLSDITGYSSLTGNRVGFSLADPAFKLYDIGWKSVDYMRECWDTYPTVRCSFKSAYTGGIVPLNKPVKPWIGLSSWFDKRSCVPKYWYNGNDACGNGDSGDFIECYNNYEFSTTGMHGVTNSESNTYAKMAKVNVECYGDENDNNLIHLEDAHCGAFWVGNVKNCSKSVSFFKGARTISSHSGSFTQQENYGESEIFAQDGNLRGAVLVISLVNPSSGEVPSELEIYLRSTQGGQNSYSKTAVSTKTNEISISVDELSNIEGFDPEQVTAVIIRNHGTNDVTIAEVKSQCEYAPRLTCPTNGVSYEAGRFSLSVTAKGSEHASSYEISASENESSVNALAKSYDCSEQGVCPNGGLEGSITLWTPEFNPYASSFTETKNYVFSVSMKVKEDDSAEEQDVDNSPCEMSYSVSPISAECRINGESSRAQGQGLPDFQYKVSGCPDLGCYYEVKLGSTTIIPVSGRTLSGNTEGWTSIPQDKRLAFNTQASPLDVASNYQITIQSVTGAASQIASCSQTFAITESSQSNNLICTYPAEVVKSTPNQRISVVSTLEHQQFNLYIDGEFVNETWMSGDQASTNDFTAPATTGTHTYKITRKGETAAQCSGSFEVTDLVPISCSIRNELVVGEQNYFDVSLGTGVQNCWSCYYENVNNGTSTDLASFPFTLTDATPKTLRVSCTCQTSQGSVSASCSKIAGIETAAPTATCPTGTINAGANAPISFTPASVANCNVGCTYSIKHSATGTEVKTGSSYTSASEIVFTGESRTGENTYEFKVTNTKGSSTPCTFKVDYKDPTVDCPTEAISAEPGATAVFRPASLAYCEGGCNYTLSLGSSAVVSKTDYSYTSASNIAFNSGSNSSGSNSFNFAVTNRANKTANCDFTVNYAKPTFTCPANTQRATGETIVVTPTNVQNCTNGCTYKVTKESASGTVVLGPTSSYTSGAFAGFDGESSPGSVTYYVTLSNPAGDGTPCSFSIGYSSCTENLTDYIVGQHDQSKQINVNMAEGGCYKFYTGKSCRKVRVQSHQASGSGKFSVNGNEFNCGTYVDGSITAGPNVTVQTNNCSLSGMEVFECFN